MVEVSGPYTLQRLPFRYGDLSGFLSAGQVQAHYLQHHAKYVDALNAALPHGPPITEIIDSGRYSAHIYNLAAQIWNHDFYWRSLRPWEPVQTFLQHEIHTLPRVKAMLTALGGYDAAKAEFKQKGIKHFGSGWVWIVLTPQGEVAIEDTHDAYNPRTQGDAPILVCDLWEHAYYLDYIAQRGDYLDRFWLSVNWPEVERRLAQLER